MSTITVKCELCGAKATALVNDLVILHTGKPYVERAIESTHWFCRKHDRNPIERDSA